MDLGTTLRKIRKYKDITQGNLSNLSGVSQSYLSLIEKGDKKPEFKTLEVICKALDINLGDVMILSLEKNDLEKNQLKRVDKLKECIMRQIYR